MIVAGGVHRGLRRLCRPMAWRRRCQQANGLDATQLPKLPPARVKVCLVPKNTVSTPPPRNFGRPTVTGSPSVINSRPLVSIGPFVYNGERFIADALNSILNQTFIDFELIISDNASTDRTGKIAQAYVKRDD